jgi:hypothetical protein
MACWAALLVSAGLMALSVAFALGGRPLSVAYAVGGRELQRHPPGGDFVAFYVAGKILNEYPHARLYDIPLQHELQHAVLPQVPDDLGVVYANAPFLALIFRGVARLPYALGLGVWVAFSASLYMAGLALVWPPKRDFGGVSRTAILVCVSFLPFTADCLAGGQLSALGFFAIALCTRWRQRGAPFAAGAALAMCLYKPPLLVLMVPLLLFGRRFRMLLGFCAGALVLGALSLGAVGYEGCAGYFRVLRLYGELTAREATPLALFKFVDVHSFFRLLLNGHPQVGGGIALILAAAAFVYLAKRWVRSRPGTQADGLLWAATIAWTLVFNLYVPIYDTTLIVISALLMAGAVYGARGEHAESGRSAFLGWMLVLYVTACVTEAVASYARVQILTPVLAAIGLLALRFSRRFEAAVE